MMHGRLSRRDLVAATLGTTLAAAHGASAQGGYPDHPITLIVPFPPGGTSDNVARLVAQRLGAQMGQTWVVENRPGAGATLGADLVARARPDGYTLLATTTAILTITPHVMAVPYDPFRSFTLLAMTAASNGVLAVHPSVPARSVAELVAYARAHPGELRFGSAGNGTITHLGGERFAQVAGIEIEHIPYRGSAQALTDLLAGRIQMIFDQVAVQAVQEGRLVGLAVTGERRNPLLPDLPTLRETGYGAEGGVSWFGLLGPAGLPGPIAARLKREIEAAVAAPEVRDTMVRMGLEPHFETGEVLRARIRADHEAFGAVVRRAQVKVD
ncbi:MAG TPA: tripartite tricarboxylate transporter substrate binding protein [Roseomonas sp.]|nr:tripartite tricarboxylate transporter substrate binding protein [Roseomonas sp.]